MVVFCTVQCHNFEMDQGGMKMQLTQIQKLMQVYDPELYTYLGMLLPHCSPDMTFMVDWALKTNYLPRLQP